MIEPYLSHEPEVHPDAWVHGAATVIGRVRIGAFSSVWPAAVLRGDDGAIAIGSCTSIQDGSVVHLTGGLSDTTVGDRVTVGHRVILHGCSVGDDVLVGMGAILLDNCRIGPRVVIGAGTVVPMNKEIPSDVLVMGNPFRIVRALEEKDYRWIEKGWRTYVERAREYRERDLAVKASTSR
jgi:carbonic anhydrase/acetyltransferase-like protein (isoleucine patch superfamily)